MYVDRMSFLKLHRNSIVCSL